jgi:hypothetical protein
VDSCFRSECATPRRFATPVESVPCPQRVSAVSAVNVSQNPELSNRDLVWAPLDGGARGETSGGVPAS